MEPRQSAHWPQQPMEVEDESRLLWRDGDYVDGINSEWQRVKGAYNEEVGFEVCRIVEVDRH